MPWNLSSALFILRNFSQMSLVWPKVNSVQALTAIKLSLLHCRDKEQSFMGMIMFNARTEWRVVMPSRHRNPNLFTLNSVSLTIQKKNVSPGLQNAYCCIPTRHLFRNIFISKWLSYFLSLGLCPDISPPLHKIIVMSAAGWSRMLANWLISAIESIVLWETAAFQKFQLKYVSWSSTRQNAKPEYGVE